MNGGTRTPLVARPRTQNERILELLADGNWHTTRAILQHVPCIVHSRIAEINKRGYRIEHDGAGGGAENHRYRLVGTSEAVDSADGRDRAVSSRQSTASGVQADGGTLAEPPRAVGTDGTARTPAYEQLVLA